LLSIFINIDICDCALNIDGGRYNPTADFGSFSGGAGMEIPFEAGGAAEESGVPFGFAQGRLSTAFGPRLTSLRMTRY
jgi:hypothetical protein